VDGQTPRAGDGGQAVPIVALMLWLTAAVAVLLAMLGGRAVDRARAQSTADAVALAVAGGGQADAMAALNNGVVEGVDSRSTNEGVDSAPTVDVVVRIGGARAGARAHRPQPLRAGLHPGLLRGLTLAEAILGEPVVIVSGLRTRAEQEILWAGRHTNPYPVAAPGTSRHERGLAVDVVLEQAGRLAQISDLTGVCQPLPTLDPVHFILCETTPTR